MESEAMNKAQKEKEREKRKEVRPNEIQSAILESNCK
jgi:hypothetical protein